MCKASVAVSHRRRRSSVPVSVTFQLSSEAVDGISCLASVICRETQQQRSGNEPVHSSGGAWVRVSPEALTPHFFPFSREADSGPAWSVTVSTWGVGFSPVGFSAAWARSCPFSFFSFPANLFPFLFVFQIFCNLCIFQMHAISSSLPQIGHMAYVIGVESCKLQDGAVHLLVWASIFAEMWHFALKSLLVAPFAQLLKCSHVIHVFGAEKCEDHYGAIHFVFLANTKCELENFQQCHLIFSTLCCCTCHIFSLFSFCTLASVPPP